MTNYDESYIVGQANSTDPYARERAAANPNTPVEILARLADDAFEDVRFEVAWNPSTTPEALARLADRF